MSCRRLDDEAPVGGQVHTLRVVRGGAFNNNNPRNLRSAYRNRNDPANRNNNIGFRVVVSTFFRTPELRVGAVPCAPRRRTAGPGPGRAVSGGAGE
jgi:hypothetical protein